ncbi:AAA family ATPase [Streptomyces sp. AN091965]|uniref:AAA family ATPase n=1 Tax=Streptomyces sp. AN091965 TaxID=2927803 RepID=UPI001F615B48|nr:AAA family ATPase [Streptomyces sp. AN091965]MCI3927701.1 ATP-binding protein [Streptomyces sp. AN091965]MCI3927726.1 ATP-binding protein [Streptomyces sp. AN091965]
MQTPDTSMPRRPGSLLLLGGPPGAGKSAVADALASGAEQPTVHLRTDSLYVWIRSGFVPPYLPQAQRQNEVVLDVMTRAACAYGRGGYDVVLDGILGPWVLAAFRTACRQDDLALAYAVLRPSLDVAIARATQRKGRQLKDTDTIVGLYGAFQELGALEGHVVDSSSQTPEQTAADLATGLRAGRFTLAATEQ